MSVIPKKPMLRFFASLLLCTLIITCIIGYNWLRGARAKAEAVACVSNLKVIGFACKQYQDKYETSPFDSAIDVSDVLNRLVKSGFILKKEQSVLKCGGINGYDYMLVTSANQIKSNSGSHAVLKCPCKNAHSFRGDINVLFDDGHVEFIKEHQPTPTTTTKDEQDKK